MKGFVKTFHQMVLSVSSLYYIMATFHSSELVDFASIAPFPRKSQQEQSLEEQFLLSRKALKVVNFRSLNEGLIDMW